MSGEVLTGELVQAITVGVDPGCDERTTVTTVLVEGERYEVPIWDTAGVAERNAKANEVAAQLRRQYGARALAVVRTMHQIAADRGRRDACAVLELVTLKIVTMNMFGGG